MDFQYNLKLIEDRDAELERLFLRADTRASDVVCRYDSAFVNLKNMVRDRDAEISDLKAC